MIDAGHLAFERMAGEPVPALPTWSGAGRLLDAWRLDALFVLVFGDDGSDARCVRPNSRAKQALETVAGVTP
ncbi:hypothetical protein [Sphaerotilus uruguayifluvii]|uniref:Uncharacterized protein n=1 Tax=Sphaerotilus uruguayifluvii TaxID=2735897 RepID=A0ABX2G6G3_9BURK|nr:hypothetical protein [Leptothrix sp. C29]NRT57918.1 hypothetical protein [Leptothrix sp. C29]